MTKTLTAAKQSRRFRERRRQGVVAVVPLEIKPSDLIPLIKSGLPRDADREAIGKVIRGLLDGWVDGWYRRRSGAIERPLARQLGDEARDWSSEERQSSGLLFEPEWPGRRCGARTRRDASCLNPGMRNGRCRLHGGKKTEEGRRLASRGNWKHGRRSRK